MMWTTVYLGWTTEKRKIIEAQWCANTILWEMNNFAFYALTSKNLRDGSNTISPNFYRIASDGDSTIKLGYSLGEDDNMTEFKSLNVSNTCRWNSSILKFERNWWNNDTISGLKMNKWFNPVSLNDNRVFYLKWSGSNKYLTWDILISLCLDHKCEKESRKEFAKRSFDGRTQTISLKSCAFYKDYDKNNDDYIKCKTRDDCKSYSDTDPTTCEEY